MTDIEKALEIYYEAEPDARDIKHWAGCNYYRNSGKNIYEPKGSATSMHDCIGCESFNICKIKMNAPIWEINEEIESDIEIKWKEMYK